MNIIDIINKKRKKGTLTKEEIFYVINGYINNQVKDYQISALLMAICINGMDEQEIAELTSIMVDTGDTLDLSMINGVKVDKHSTGGVGDKATLVIAPLVASCGLVVPKMSGRGLGHTGGTIDKLESIPNFKVDLTNSEFTDQLKNIGVAITSSNLNIAPADKKLYALRDVTGTVSSIPLIASSIMSKKIATNADKIVLDVKVGDGALMANIEQATHLARTMVQIGKNLGKETVALLTNMNYPLGSSIGNGLEVQEAIEMLKGNGDKNFKELCITIASYMVSIGKGIDLDVARNEVVEHLKNGQAYEKFLQMVTAQEGDINKINISNKMVTYRALTSGYLNNIKTLELGNYVMKMGAGRSTKEDDIDHGVGIVLNHQCGDYINQGETLATLYVRNENINVTPLDDMFIIEQTARELEPLIYDVIK